MSNSSRVAHNFNRVIIGDCRETLRALPAGAFQCCVTSPPYWGLRDYGHTDQIGMEPTPDEYVTHLVEVFQLVRRALRDDGTLWLNLGDSYAAQRGGTTMPAETLAGGRGNVDAHRGRPSTATLADGRIESSPCARNGRVAHRNARAFGLKHKDLCGMPWRVAFALQADGWWLRQDIIWHKPNPMPESVRDRCTKAHEYVFLLAKSERYYYDHAAMQEPAVTAGRVMEYTGDQKSNNADLIRQRTLPKGRTMIIGDTRNARSVWTIGSQGYDGAHFATMPPRLAERCILAGSRVGSVVLDPFLGSGTVGMVAERHGRRWLGCEINPEYEPLIRERMSTRAGTRAS